jgi:hypothetical protein
MYKSFLAVRVLKNSSANSKTNGGVLMSVQKRRVSLGKSFMNKNVDDILYALLLINSNFDVETKQRYINKDDVDFEEMERHFDYKIDKNILSNNLNKLIKVNLLKETTLNDNDCYVFFYSKEPFKLIALDTLKLLEETFIPNILKVYVYLLNRWEWKNKDATFTKEEIIKKCLKIKYPNSKDLENLEEILNFLVDNNLLEYTTETRIFYGNKTSLNMLVRME